MILHLTTDPSSTIELHIHLGEANGPILAIGDNEPKPTPAIPPKRWNRLLVLGVTAVFAFGGYQLMPRSAGSQGATGTSATAQADGKKGTPYPVAPAVIPPALQHALQGPPVVTPPPSGSAAPGGAAGGNPFGLE